MINRKGSIKQNGFTLLELMVIISIMAILALAAMPSYQAMMRRKEVSKYVNQLKSSLNFARQAAHTSGRVITLCPVLDINGSPQCASWNVLNDSTKNTAAGWVVFFDRNNNNQYDRPPELDPDIVVAPGTPRTVGDVLYKVAPYRSNKTAISWTRNAVSPTIQMTTRGSTGNAGTLRVFTSRLGSLQPWSPATPPPINSGMNESRVVLTSLGMVTIQDSRTGI